MTTTTRTPAGAVEAIPSALWYTRCPVPTSSSIAIAEGWLDDEFGRDGIDVRSLAATTDRRVRESHFDHSQPNSFRQGGNIPPIWARSRGSDVRLIGASWIEQYQALVSLPGSGVASPSDLRGRRVALPRRLNDQIDFARAIALRGVLTVLDQAGLEPDAVEFVDLPVEETFIDNAASSERGSLFSALHGRRFNAAEAFALIRGDVDAIYLSTARGAELAALLGAVVVADIGSLPDVSSRVNGSTPALLTVSGQLLEDHPDLVARYVAAGLRAAAWAATHPDETRRIVAQEVGSSEEAVDVAYASGINARLAPSLDADLLDAVGSQKDFLLRHGFIERDFDLDEWVDSGPLEEARRLLGSSR